MSLEIPQNSAKDIEKSIDAGPVLYREESIQGKGKGLIAAQHIKAGTCILSEAPLFTTESITSLETQERTLGAILRGLSKDAQRGFLSLHNKNPGREPLSNIVRTNAYPLGPGSTVGAIFLTIARINHSCRPNAQQAWNAAAKQETVHVLRDIKPGEEITMSYSDGGPSKERREKLNEYFGFECTCEVCSLPEAELKISDARLLKAQKLDEAIGNPRRVNLTPDRALADCKALLDLYKEEGIADTRIPRLYYDAFQICVMHSDQARAKVMAERIAQAKILCEGQSSQEAKEMMNIAKNPSEHESFGATKKWAQSADKVPKDLSAEDFEKWLWRQAS